MISLYVSKYSTIKTPIVIHNFMEFKIKMIMIMVHAQNWKIGSIESKIHLLRRLSDLYLVSTFVGPHSYPT